jgi:nitrogen PTS system EIIA component
MVEVLNQAGHFNEQGASEIARAIGARERVGSTAIGKGLALPHCRTDLVDQFTGVVIIDPRGIDFGALDGLLVYAVFLVIGPEGRHEEHFDVLARLNGLQFDKGTRLKLFGCRTSAEVAVVLGELDREW